MKFFHLKPKSQSGKYIFLDKFLDKSEIVEDRDGKVVQARVGVLSQEVDLLSLSSTFELPVGQPPGVKLLHELSRDDLQAVLPKFSENKGSNDDAILDLVNERLGVHEGTKTQEKIKQCKVVLTEAIEILESEFEIGIPNSIKGQVNNLNNLRDLNGFINAAQGIKDHQKGPIVCGILKVADCLIEINNAPELDGLIEKTAQFEQDLYEQALNVEKDGTSYTNPYGFIQFTGANTHFEAREVKFDTKSRSRIVGKLLRKVGFNVPDLVRDGVRSRIVIPDSDNTESEIEMAKDYVLGLKDYKFEIKDESAHNQAGNNDREDTVLIGTIPGTDTAVEVVIQSDRNYLTHEHGIKNHEPYEWIQNFQALCRIWGSVGKSRYERKLKELAQKKYFLNEKDKTGYNIAFDTLKKAFSEHFYFNSETGRYHWYDYDFRTNGAGVFTPEYQAERNIGAIRSIQDRAREYHPNLGDIPYNTWEFILENNTFPDEDLADNLGQQVIDFLNSVRGIPKLISKTLEIQLDTINSDEFESFRHWEFIFGDLGFPDIMALKDRKKVIEQLKDKDEKVFKFLIRILETKLETGEVIQTYK